VDYLAATADNPANLLSPFLQLGVVGVVNIVLFYIARSLIQREQTRADRIEEDNRRINSLMTDQMVPALTKATEAIVDAQRLIEEMKRERDVEAEARRRMRDERDNRGRNA